MRDLEPAAEACWREMLTFIKAGKVDELGTLSARHPNVSRRNFQRLAARARALPSVQNRAAREAFAAVAELATTAPAEAISQAPPAAAMKPGADAAAVIDLMVLLRDGLAAAEKLRSYAVSVDKAGNEVIRNPMLFAKSIELGRKFVESMVRTWQEAFSPERVAEYWEVILDEIYKADPATQIAIMQRLKALNEGRNLGPGFGAPG